MKRITLTAVVCSLILGVGGFREAGAQAPATEDEKTIYAIGLAIAQNLGQFNFSEAELKVLTQGLTDAALNRETTVKLEEYGPKIQAFAQARVEMAASKEKEAGAAFLKAEEAKPGATKTDSGLIYTELQAGEGAVPVATDTVTVNYRGTLRDGKQFDSSYDRGQPASFRLNGVIPCWTEGLQRMKPGGKARLVCPAAIAYGDRGAPPNIPPGAALVFEVELLSIGSPKPAEAPAPAPSN